MKTVVAISGWKRSGKDTVAEFLVKKYGFQRVAFADTLKEMVAQEYGITVDHCNNPELKEKPLLKYPVMCKDGFSRTVNLFMQGEFRTEDGIPGKNVAVLEQSPDKPLVSYGDSYVWGRQLYHTPRSLCILKGSTNRSVDSDYWVNRAISGLPSGRFVISDLRYKSEVNSLFKKLNEVGESKLVLLRINRFKVNPSSDPSECDLDDFEFSNTIENTGTLEELFVNVTERLAKHGAI